MNMEDYEPKQRFRRVITNTFPSEEDCDIFIMLLKTAREELVLQEDTKIEEK